MTIATAADALAFWRAAGPDKWFKKSDAFDAEIRARFLATYEAAAAGQLSDWEATPEGALALTIVLDQFPRNIFRHDPRAFAADATARGVADRALARGFDSRFPVAERYFFYMPFEHSEAMADQERCCALFRAMGDADLLHWAELHADVIRRFGRFPHRNAVLGRTTTPAEKSFLDNGGFAA
ncbi:MAG TPA: DUF924 family protein [Xanthobacteraceae bacterium]|nr:DUF924 family protein [Xanthobacteraceae bacterium]